MAVGTGGHRDAVELQLNVPLPSLTFSNTLI